jgi:hypothetical protein
MRTVALVAATLVVVLALALLVRIAVESRYQSCVQRAAALTADVQPVAGEGGIDLDELLRDGGASDRARAVGRCSRSRF